MVFIMLPCAALMLSACKPNSQSANPWGLHLLNAQSHVEYGAVIINSGIELDLSPDTEQALRQGIPISLVMDARIARHRHFWAWLIEEQQLTWRISYLPLSRQFALIGPTGQRTTYSRLRHLIAALREPRLIRLQAGGGTEDARYQVQLRVYLDIQSLPSPLRLPALFSPQWRLKSAWTTWHVARG